MIYCERGSDWGWEWALIRKPSMLAQHAVCNIRPWPSKANSKSDKAVNLSENVARSLTPPLVVPLGRTPPYLDPQSQEATYEVDVSGMPINMYFNGNQDDKTKGLI
jgi:hypothetical protein